MLTQSIGIIGGTGWIGKSFGLRFLAVDLLPEQQLWIANRSGERGDFDAHAEVHVTNDLPALTDACDVVIVSVLPHQFPDLQVDLSGKLVISVMAGISIEQLKQKTHAGRVVRAMPMASCLLGKSYTPWMGSEALSNEDKQLLQILFEAVGQADEVADEDTVAFLTGLAGCSPGMLTYYANAYAEAAMEYGLDEAMANKIARTVFEGAGAFIAHDHETPKQAMQTMLDYAGSTAEGIKVLQEANIAPAIKASIQAAYRKSAGDMSA